MYILDCDKIKYIDIFYCIDNIYIRIYVFVKINTNVYSQCN